jgi:murein DD-endopeptidase MepM/ murein hydrolase activator NlpD
VLLSAAWNEPEAAVVNGATVTAGQLLYHVGNSGNSS